MSSCLNMNDPQKQSEYVEVYNLFEKSLVDHIPNKLPNNKISTTWSRPDYYSELGKYSDIPNQSHISVLTQIRNKEKYVELKRKYTKGAKYIKSTKDNCFGIIRTYEKNIDNSIDTTCEPIVPVPEFAIFEYGENNEDWVQIEKGQIIILDCKSGNYTGVDKIKPNTEMPKGFQNGFSKGLTFNDPKQTIEYWLVIW